MLFDIICRQTFLKCIMQSSFRCLIKSGHKMFSWNLHFCLFSGMSTWTRITGTRIISIGLSTSLSFSFVLACSLISSWDKEDCTCWKVCVSLLLHPFFPTHYAFTYFLSYFGGYEVFQVIAGSFVKLSPYVSCDAVPFSNLLSR